MPFTVITLKKVPESLRGDLTRWMQEIATGVYVGSYNSRVREYLWKRVTDTVGQGEATLSFSCRNEIGYNFCTYNTERKVIDFDGIPLVLIPVDTSSEESTNDKPHGFSDASKYHQARRKVRTKAEPKSQKEAFEGLSVSSEESDDQIVKDVVFLDIETTGLNADTDEIIEIGAVKVSDDKIIEFHRLIRINSSIPDIVSKLTGISDDMLSKGISIEECIQDFNSFIQGAVIIGYNISFDINFLNKALQKFSLEPIHNKIIDLMQEAKKRNGFQSNYKFETTLKEYGIKKAVLHRALEDAKLMQELYNQMGLG